MRTKTALATVALFVSGTALALACNVPVFRYALERWSSDPYVLLVFHEGPLSPEQQSLIDRFRAFEQSAPGEPGRITPVNLFVDALDVREKLPEEVAGIWARQEAAARGPEGGFPWMVLRFPWESGLNADVWSGRFTEANLDRLLVSPKRNELASRILEGDSAVWIVISSGDAERDAKVAKELTATLEFFEKQDLLPELSPEDQQLLAPGGPKLEVKFSVLPIDRNDPREQFFVQSMLAAARANIENQITQFDRMLDERRARIEELEKDPETDPELLAQRKEGLVNIAKRYDEVKAGLRKALADLDGPVVVPVAGRGRAIEVLAGETLIPSVYSNVCGFLLGPCSCEIKEQNPGFDLLISADWIGRISGEFTVREALPELTGPFATIGALPPEAKNSPTEVASATTTVAGPPDAAAVEEANTDAGSPEQTPASQLSGESASAPAEPPAATADSPEVTLAAPAPPASSAVESDSLLLRNVAIALICGVVVVLGAGVALQWKRG